MANGFCHMELQAADLDAAHTFYSELFDWKLDKQDMGGGHVYTLINAGEGPGGGMTNLQNPNSPTAWLVYVQVDSVDDTCEKAASLGGKVIMGKTPVPGMGSFAVLNDSQGAVFAVWENEKN